MRPDFSQRAAHETGWAQSALPANQRFVAANMGGSGAALPVGKAIVVFLAMSSAAMAEFQKIGRDLIELPQSLKIVLHDLHESPSVVTFKRSNVTDTQLSDFASDLCKHDHAEIKMVNPFLFNRLRGRSRAHISCWSSKK
ncbi:hypothetical protein [Algirhabdus cladophorae]|uniref:hypothetical protein n=1 Tax=Algirhabdus cladophorae TaxID=3377108 RepID=UPI003B84AF38